MTFEKALYFAFLTGCFGEHKTGTILLPVVRLQHVEIEAFGVDL